MLHNVSNKIVVFVYTDTLYLMATNLVKDSIVNNICLITKLPKSCINWGRVIVSLPR